MKKARDALDDMGHAHTKLTKLLEAKRIYLLAPDGLTDSELAQHLQIDRSSAFRYRKELGAVEVVEGRYTLLPTEQDIQFALAVLQRAHR